MRGTERLAPVGAAMSAVATFACCLPFGTAGAMGAFGLSVVLAWLQPWFIGLAVILLGVGVLQVYRGRRSCQRRSRLSLILLGFSAAIVVAVLGFPQRVAELMANYL